MAKSLPTARRSCPRWRRARSDHVGPTGCRRTAGAGGATGCGRGAGRGATGRRRGGRAAGPEEEEAARQAAAGGGQKARQAGLALNHERRVAGLQGVTQPGGLTGQAVAFGGPQPGSGRVGEEGGRRVQGRHGRRRRRRAEPSELPVPRGTGAAAKPLARSPRRAAVPELMAPASTASRMKRSTDPRSIRSSP